MNRYTPTITADASDQLITASHAARLLAVHISTVRRWIAQGKLPAYRVGEKGVRLRYGDVLQLITPMTQADEKGRRMGQPERKAIPRLTMEEQERGLGALAELERLNEELLAKRGGKPFPDSTELIREMREERTRQLMRALEE